MIKVIAPAPRGDQERGATAVEYGLLVAAIAAVVVVSVFLLGDAARGMFTSSCDTIQSQTNTSADCNG